MIFLTELRQKPDTKLIFFNVPGHRYFCLLSFFSSYRSFFLFHSKNKKTEGGD